MLVPMNRLKNVFQCPISGRKFEFYTLRQKREALHAQQEFTSNLIIELDGPNASGIRRPILSYHNQYNRRRAKSAA